MASGSTTRADKALATRRRMVNAAYDQFCANGYLGTTITAIATDAGVAVPTIYYTFGTKARLLDEALGAAIVGFDRWHEPPADPSIEELLPWHHWWTDFNAAPTSAEALGIFLTNGVAILERVAPLMAALHGAAGDPEAADVTGSPSNDASRPTAKPRELSLRRRAACVTASRSRRRPTCSSCCSAPSCTNRSVTAEAGPRTGQPSSCGTCYRHSCSAATVRDRVPLG